VRFEDDDGTSATTRRRHEQEAGVPPLAPQAGARLVGLQPEPRAPDPEHARAHKGVDYSAPVGTPVKATGAGLVTFSGRKNGYGNVIELQHGEKYSTCTATCRGSRGLRVGEPVKQAR